MQELNRRLVVIPVVEFVEVVKVCCADDRVQMLDVRGKV